MSIRRMWKVGSRVAFSWTFSTYLNFRVSFKVPFPRYADIWFTSNFFRLFSDSRISLVGRRLVTGVIARNVSLVPHTDKIHVLYDSQHKSLPCERKENERMDITRKWRTASLRWNHSWKPTSGFARRTVEIGTDFLSLWKEIVISQRIALKRI